VRIDWGLSINEQSSRKDVKTKRKREEKEEKEEKE
jgi:hypothetical protein